MPRKYLNPSYRITGRGSGGGPNYQGAKLSQGKQGAGIECPWSQDPMSLGRPKSQQKAEPMQGQFVRPLPVSQGKFYGKDKLAKNLKNFPPQAPGSKAWPNRGMVKKGGMYTNARGNGRGMKYGTKKGM